MFPVFVADGKKQRFHLPRSDFTVTPHFQFKINLKKDWCNFPKVIDPTRHCGL
jgi:hypothetical protein